MPQLVSFFCKQISYAPPRAHAFISLPLQSSLSDVKEQYDRLSKETQEQYEIMHDLADSLKNEELSKSETQEKNKELVETEKEWNKDQERLEELTKEYETQGGDTADLHSPSYLDDDLESNDSVTNGTSEAYKITGEDMSSDENSEDENTNYENNE